MKGNRISSQDRFSGRNKMELGDIIPYASVFIDCNVSDIVAATRRCFIRFSEEEREELLSQLRALFTTSENPGHVLPCYTVRTGFDLFLECKRFPKNSEVIMSAVNIPDMANIVRQHGLRAVPVDIDIDTISMNDEDLELAINDRTVAIVIAHVYGKWLDVSKFLSIAKMHGLYFIEDCAESFCGFDRLGSRDSDISLFSFGTIKTCTAFGGAVVKIKDKNLYDEMISMYAKYPMQSTREYLNKLQKCLFIYHMLNVPCLVKRGMELSRVLNIDHQKFAVNMMRGFNANELFTSLRKQLSTALLATMIERLKSFNKEKHEKDQERMSYVIDRLPPEMKVVGSMCSTKNFWLFPVLTENPTFVVSMLRQLGVDAYVGSTQLDVIYPDDCQIPDVTISSESLNKYISDRSSLTLSDGSTANSKFPYHGKYLIDHVVYLPVHKRVPYKLLDKICFALHVVAAKQKLMTIPNLTRSAKL